MKNTVKLCNKETIQSVYSWLLKLSMASNAPKGLWLE